MRSSDDMAAAHDKYLERILHHVDEQLTRTRREVDRSITEIQLILVGGVTRAPYIVKKIEEHITSTTKVRVVAIEEAFRSVVAIGCVLFMGQNNFGGRYRSKEAYGIPVAEAYNKKTHGSKNCITDERTDKGEEARDLADWIVKVVSRMTVFRDYLLTTTHRVILPPSTPTHTNGRSPSRTSTEDGVRLIRGKILHSP